ncbi:hypothetical protein GOV13_01875 [Candidatus Pacearchaeota archaeon]|nr:hypothetical protein [Candidatus Pacearchaeota archaeon]
MKKVKDFFATTEEVIGARRRLELLLKKVGLPKIPDNTIADPRDKDILLIDSWEYFIPGKRWACSVKDYFFQRKTELLRYDFLK